VASPALKTAAIAGAADDGEPLASAAEPANLAIWLRLGAPAHDLPFAAVLLPLDPQIAAVLQRPGLLLGLGLGSTLAGAADLEQPVDLACPLVTDGAPMSDRYAFSIAMKSAGPDPAALRDTFHLVTKSFGRIGLEDAGGGGGGKIGQRLACDLWPAWRGVASRLVCASDAPLLESFGPYLARGVAQRPAGPAVRLHTTSAMLRQGSNGIAAPTAGTDDATTRTITAWASQYLDDVGSIDTTLDLPNGHVQIVVEETFRRAASVATTLQLARPGEPQRLPEAFWRLPIDSDVALYFQGAPPALVRPLGAKAFQEIIAAVPAEELPASAHAEIVDALKTLFLTGGPVLVAHGHDRAAAQKALDKLLATPDASGKKQPTPAAAKALVAARSALQGWTLVHVDEPPRVWHDGLRELARVMIKDYSIEAAAALKAEAKSGAPAAPAKPKKVNRETSTVTEIAVKAAEGLPEGSLHFALHTRKNKAFVPEAASAQPPVIDHDFHLFMAPDGESAWLALAEDEALARARLQIQVKRAATGTLADRSDLAALRAQAGAGAGFTTLSGVVSLLLPDESRAKMASAREQLAVAQTLARHGSTPIPLLWTSTEDRAAEGGAPLHRVALTVDLAPETIGDLVQTYLNQPGAQAP
jgi:hypothetical protein